MDIKLDYARLLLPKNKKIKIVLLKIRLFGDTDGLLFIY